MKRRGIARLVVGGVLSAILIATTVILVFGADIPGFSMLYDGIRFASGGGQALVQTGSMGLLSDTFTGNATIAPTCSVTPKNSFIGLLNTGTANGAAKGVMIRYAGAENSFAIAGSCTIGPAGSPTATTYILFKGPSKLPNSAVPKPGLAYSGIVSLSNGAQLPFLGSFSEGYPQVSATGLSLSASGFTQGNPSNSTCSTTHSAANNYVMLNNTGTVGASVTAVTIAWKNATNTFLISGSCNVGPDGTPSAVMYVLFGENNKLSVAAEGGQPFTGIVGLSTRMQIPFSGSFK